MTTAPHRECAPEKAHLRALVGGRTRARGHADTGSKGSAEGRLDHEFETVGVIGIGPYSERRREGLFEGIASGFGAANG